MPIYNDPVRFVREELEAKGAQPTFIAMECDVVSKQVIAGDWLQVEGEAIYKVTGKPAENVSEYVALLLKEKPHGLWELIVADDAETTFLGDGKNRSLSAAGEFIAKYGEQVYHATKLQYGCDDKTLVDGKLKAGTKPGTKSETEKNGPPGGGGQNNPWSKSWLGSEDARAAKIGEICKKGSKFATDMAAAAGTTIGRPLRK